MAARGDQCCRFDKRGSEYVQRRADGLVLGRQHTYGPGAKLATVLIDQNCCRVMGSCQTKVQPAGNAGA